MSEHDIRTTYEGERAYWECSCGRAGSCDADLVDIRSDVHIREGERRRDVYPG